MKQITNFTKLIYIRKSGKLEGKKYGSITQSFFFFFSFGYDKKSSCYKILRMDTFHIEYEVYDFTSNSWKNIHETRDLSISQIGSHASVNGNTYWLGLSKEDPSGIILICFDFSIRDFELCLFPRIQKVILITVMWLYQWLEKGNNFVC